MAFLDWSKKRMLAALTIALAGLSQINLFGINSMLSPILGKAVYGDITISTIVGVATVAIAVAFYQRKLG